MSTNNDSRLLSDVTFTEFLEAVRGVVNPPPPTVLNGIPGLVQFIGCSRNKAKEVARIVPSIALGPRRRVYLISEVLETLRKHPELLNPTTKKEVPHE